MNFAKRAAGLLLMGILLFFALEASAAEIRRVPDYDTVEQGIMALTLDVVGAENFRYEGEEKKTHLYRGKINPGSKLKIVFSATVAGQKSVPVTSRSSALRVQVAAKKDGKVVKTQNFKKDNQPDFALNYTVPGGADTVEITEIYVLSNKSKNKQFNRRTSCRNKVILSAKDQGAAAAAPAKKTEGGEKAAAAASEGDESKGKSMLPLAGGAAAVIAAAGGAFYFLKKKKEAGAAEAAQKQENLRRQQEMAANDPVRHQQEALRQQQEEAYRQELMRQQEEARRQELMRQQEEIRRQEMLRRRAEAQQPQTPGAGIGAAAGMVSPEAAAPEAPRFCTNCGSKLEPDSLFCGNCGAKV